MSARPQRYLIAVVIEVYGTFEVRFAVHCEVVAVYKITVVICSGICSKLKRTARSDNAVIIAQLLKSVNKTESEGIAYHICGYGKLQTELSCVAAYPLLVRSDKVAV